MLRHQIHQLIAQFRALTSDRLLALGLVATCGFGVLWVLYVIVSATVYPSRSPMPEETAGLMAEFEFAAMPKPAPATTFLDANGQKVSFRDKAGKVVLLNLWATWCAPCVREMPMLDRLQAELGSDRFEVVAVSMDREGLDVVLPFLEENQINNLAVYNDPTFGLARELQVAGLPVTVLIGARGLEIGRLIGPAEWDSQDAKDLIQRYIGNS